MTDVDHQPARSAVVRVLVVDDQAPYRDAIATVVATESGFELVAALESAHDLDRVIDQVRPDLILLDVRMPDANGAAVAVNVRRDHPEVTVLLMSVFSCEEIPGEVFDAGVRFVEKENFGADTLLDLGMEIERNRSAG